MWAHAQSLLRGRRAGKCASDYACVCVCSLLISPRTPLCYLSWLKYVSVCLSLLYTFLFDCMPRIPLPLYRCTEPASAVGHISLHVRFFGRLRWCFSWLRLSFNHTHTRPHTRTAPPPSSLLLPCIHCYSAEADIIYLLFLVVCHNLPV